MGYDGYHVLGLHFQHAKHMKRIDIHIYIYNMSLFFDGNSKTQHLKWRWFTGLRCDNIGYDGILVLRLQWH